MNVALLNSGGKDSLAAAILLREDPAIRLHSLFVDVGQPNRIEAELSARRIAAKYAEDHETIPVGSGGYRAPVDSGRFVAVCHQTIMLYGIAAMYATSRGWQVVASGVRCDAVAPGFPAALEALFATSRLRAPPAFLFPVLALGDAAVIEIAARDPLYLETVGCNESPPCGTCHRCRLRAEAIPRSLGSSWCPSRIREA